MFNSIIRLKRDSELNYQRVESTFIPQSGEVCLVDTASNGLRIKIGDGETLFKNLNYCNFGIKYSELYGIPITFKDGVGTVLSTLSVGDWVLSGSYVYTMIDFQNKDIDGILYVSVVLDQTTGKKVAYFDTFENGSMYTTKLIFNNDNTCEYSKDPAKQISFIDSATDLPETGEENILYPTDEYIYRWINNKYVNLSTSKWEQF